MKSLLVVAALLFFSPQVFAVCTAPSGVAGQMTLVGGVINYCDGTLWQDLFVNVQAACGAGDVGRVQYVAGDAQICNGTSWFSIKGTIVEACTIAEIGTLTWRNVHDGLQYCDGVNWHVTYNATAPQVTSFEINGGAATTINNNVLTDLDASATDGKSLLTHFCYKYSTNATVPTAPLVDDTCWQSYAAASPGLTPGVTMSFTGHYSLLGFAETTYNVYAWVKTNAGLISTLTNSGNGTDGVDKKTIEYDPNPPPIVVNVLSASTDAATFPLSPSDITVAAGSTVYIKWNASAISGFGATPIDLYYTEDETNYTLIASDVSNSANTGCTVDGSTFTGCYTWTNGSPTSSYFRIRVDATDSAGILAYSSGPGMNVSTFNTLAGNTDTGLNGNANSAIIFNNTGSSVVDVDGMSFVVTDAGDFYIRDIKRGILKMDVNTGLLTEYISHTGSHTDGPVATATLRSLQTRMTLDFNGDIILYDYDRIKRIDLDTETVTTIIGGGATAANDTAALDFLMGGCQSTRSYTCRLVVLPNDDIYFLRRGAHASTPGAGEAIWHYQASNQRVYSMVPSGTGTEQNATRDIATSKLGGFILDFDSVTSNIDHFFGTFQRQPCSGCGPHQESAELNQTTWASLGSGYPLPGGGYYYSQVTSLDGELYVVSNVKGLYKYDEVGNTWTHVVGSGTRGSCVDGTPATSCDMNLRDAFVTAQGNIYFMDNGQMRAVDASGNVITVFGQKFDFGDGGLATSARFGGIHAIDESASGKIAVLDFVENNLREFTDGGNINKLIGNHKTTGSVSGSPGVTQPINGHCSFAKCRFFYDDANDDIFYVTQSRIFRYDRASGNIVLEFGQGSNDFATSDGLVGSSIDIGGYSPKIYGFNGTHIVAGSNWWNGTFHERGFIKLYDKTDSWRQSSFMGVAGATVSSFPSDGSTLATSAIPRPHQFGEAIWDSATSAWYFKQSNLIRSFPPGGVAGTLVTLPRSISAGWTMVQNGSSEWVIYYCSSSRVYKYNVTTTTETALPWPSSTISCAGNALHYSATRQSVVFPYQQNSMWAVGEILDTP